MGNHYRHSYVYRPTEIEAFRNIERENRVAKEWGYNPHFTEFEKRVYSMDLEIRSKIIPDAIRHNNKAVTHADELRVPIVIYEIANITKHTPDFIQRTMETIDNKVWLRQRLGYKQVLPVVKKVVG